jgi:cell fate regulator YaaT (PSP1 superfamily)
MSMPQHYLVRYGALAHIDTFCSNNPRVLSRSTEVLVESHRGVEIGEILTPRDGQALQTSGTILRALTPADQLIAQRIGKNKLKAFAACRSMLADLASPATLIDLELLFDGQTLIFYFLGELPEQIESISDSLVQTFDAKVQFRQFTEAVLNGCGPDCGTKDTCGTCDSCSSCTVAIGRSC